MAELFGARHLAMPKVEDPKFAAKCEAEAYVNRNTLFIYGVGTLDSGLMARSLKDTDCEVPDWTVGDLAFNPARSKRQRCDAPRNSSLANGKG
jgi:hypothetical protein